MGGNYSKIKRRHGKGIAEEEPAKGMTDPEFTLSKDDIEQLVTIIESTLRGEDEALCMPDDLKRKANHLANHLGTDKVVVGLKFAKEAAGGLSNLPWVGAGLSLVAMGLDMFLKAEGNQKQCRSLMGKYLDAWKRYIRPLLENGDATDTDRIQECIEIIVEGFQFCQELSKSGGGKRFMHADHFNERIKELEVKLNGFMVLEIAVNTARPRRIPVSLTPSVVSVGLEDRKLAVMKLMQPEATEEVRIVVLHGMGGVGKSLLGEIVYREISQNMTSTCHIEVGEKPSEEKIIDLQKRMVERLTGSQIQNDSEMVKDGLRKLLSNEEGKPFLVFIDNVLLRTDLEELLCLDFERIRLPKGSRLLVTTRDSSVCSKVFKRNSGFVLEQFKVEPLKESDAWKLFCMNAFGTENPSCEDIETYDDGQDLIRKLVTLICCCLPLALRLLGKSLYGADLHVWRRKYNNLERWADAKEEEKIKNVLKSSYDCLDKETQTAFLMACVFFKDGDYKIFEQVVKSAFPGAKISRLRELCLLEEATIVHRFDHTSYFNCDRLVSYGSGGGMNIHDLVRNLGYNLAVEKKYVPTIMPTCIQDFVKVDDETWSRMKWLSVPYMKDGIDAHFIEKCTRLEIIDLRSHVIGNVSNPPPRLNVFMDWTPERLSLMIPCKWSWEKLNDLCFLCVFHDLEFSALAPPLRLRGFRGYSDGGIPDECIDMHKDTLRVFSCVDLSELSFKFCEKMTNLQTLELPEFKGKSLPKELGRLSNLEELVITSNTIEEIPAESLEPLTRLRLLRLIIGDKLKEFPNGVLQKMKELQWLQLGLKGVTCMPSIEPGQLPSLKSAIVYVPQRYEHECLKVTVYDQGVLTICSVWDKFHQVAQFRCRSHLRLIPINQYCEEAGDNALAAVIALQQMSVSYDELRRRYTILRAISHGGSAQL